MLGIHVSNYCPSDSYFTATDIEPNLSEGGLVIYTGYGKKKYWGTPRVTSTIVYRDDALVAIHVGFHHKFRGGQFWRYYRILDNQFVQVKWGSLKDPERQAILDAADKNAPGWAKSPGKLKTERVSLPEGYGYKLVGIREGMMVSLYDETTEYILGVTLFEEALPGHGGGYFFYRNIESARSLKNTEMAEGFYEFALLLVKVGGTIVDYGVKHAASEMTPEKILVKLGR